MRERGVEACVDRGERFGVRWDHESARDDDGVETERRDAVLRRRGVVGYAHEGDVRVVGSREMRWR